MWFWPNIQLTEYEKKFVSMYKASGKPGVLRRVYRVQLASQAQPDNNIPAVALTGKIQIARRSRIFGMTFTGNLDGWRLSVRNTNGTLYTNPTPRTNLFPVVSSLVAGSYANAAALGGLTQPLSYTPLGATQSVGPTLGPYNFGFQVANSFPVRSNFPWLIEPNWVCQPNETIIFEGTDISPTWVIPGDLPVTFRVPQVLNIAFYAWEFPKMSC